MKKIIALYLPQYHPTESNNTWWGTGFTEWTNVAKAKKLFRGHYQPKVPKDLGFYDLRLPEIRAAQAEMAKNAGIYGFCYYHYWFEYGKKELQMPFEEVVRMKKPDFPFCLCWANESWYSKLWNKDGDVIGKKILAEQKYLGVEDNKLHFFDLLEAFKDERYIKIDNRLVFMIYKPLEFVGIEEFIDQWNNLALSNGLPKFYFIGYTFNVSEEKDAILNLGFDAICSCKLSLYATNNKIVKRIMRILKKIIQFITNRPRTIDYRKIYKYYIGEEEKANNVFPTIIPNWDHTPRSGVNGDVVTHTNPANFDKHMKEVINLLNSKPEDSQIAFLKSWNEWGEGNYVEPDLKFGHGFLDVLKKYLIK